MQAFCMIDSVLSGFFVLIDSVLSGFEGYIPDLSQSPLQVWHFFDAIDVTLHILVLLHGAVTVR